MVSGTTCGLTRCPTEQRSTNCPRRAGSLQGSRGALSGGGGGLGSVRWLPRRLAVPTRREAGPQAWTDCLCAGHEPGRDGDQPTGKPPNSRCVEGVILGTIWGPHVMRDLEQRAYEHDPANDLSPRLSCENAYAMVLGVKGSQVRILSARPNEIAR
jgi:hypothetical protein